MSQFVKVGHVRDLPDPGKKVLEVEERLVVLFHVDGQYHCLEDLCTHDGGPLGEGCLVGHTIACPRHGAKFDIRSGDALTMPATEATLRHDVKVDGDEVFVRIKEEE